jgi:predicted PurR-regulated permease PerM
MADENDFVPPAPMVWDLQLIARIALVVAATVLGVWMLWRFLPSLAWAAVLAIATWPLRAELARRGLGKTALAALLTVLVALVLVVPLVLIGIEAARESGIIVALLRNVRLHGLATPEWLSGLPLVGAYVAEWWQTHLADPAGARELFGGAEARSMLGWTRTLGIEAASRLTILVFTLLTLFFLYRDGPRINEQGHVIAARLIGAPAKRLGKDAVGAVRGTVNGLVLVGLGEGVLLGFAYALAGVPHPILFALATGVLATVPFGAPLVYIVATLLLLAQSKMAAAIAVFVAGSVIVFVADHFIRPVLIGSSTRLPFLWVLLGIFGGLETFGLVGLFLGPALMSLLVSIWRDAAEAKGGSL